METAIISEKLLKENSPIKEETIISKFVPFVIVAQKLHIKTLIGQALYEELQTQVKANNLTAHNKALIIEIAPALSFWTLYYGLPFHWAQIQTKGVLLEKSDNSESVDLPTLSVLQKKYLDIADLFTTQLKQYLTRCASNYPLYRPPVDECGKSEYFNPIGSISTPKRKKHDRY